MFRSERITNPAAGKLEEDKGSGLGGWYAVYSTRYGCNEPLVKVRQVYLDVVMKALEQADGL